MLIHSPQTHHFLKLLQLLFFKLALFDFLSGVFDSVEHSGVLVWPVVMYLDVFTDVTDEGIPSVFFSHSQNLLLDSHFYFFSITCMSDSPSLEA